MLKHKSFNWFITAMMVLAAITFIGCEKKNEQQNNDVKSESISPESIQTENEPTVIEPANEEKITIPDVKGIWTGTFDKRTTTLTITEQTDSNFSGKISIKYKETINQDVKGTFRPATQKVSMEDQVHSKYMGKYDGKLSDDGNNLSGTFTMNRDGTKTSFNLNKK